MSKRLFILSVFCAWCWALCAEPIQQPHYLLGSGGSQYSNRKPHLDRHGLRTGLYTGEHHLVGLWADGGYSALLNNVPVAMSRPGGYGVGVGIAYEYELDFLAVQIGIGVHWQDVRNRVSDTTFYKLNVADSWTGKDGYRYDLRYDFYDRMDYARNWYVEVPVMVGGNFYGAYVMGGIKMAYAFAGNTKVVATGTTTGQYDRYMGTFQEMDNHGLRKDVPVLREKQDRLHLKLDVKLCAEAGYEWAVFAPERGYRYTDAFDMRVRLGGFVEYGLLNINPKTSLPFSEIPDEYKYDFPMYRFSHVLGSTEADGYKVHNFLVGAKLTVLFGVKAKEHCVLCGHHETEATMSGY